MHLCADAPVALPPVSLIHLPSQMILDWVYSRNEFCRGGQSKCRIRVILFLIFVVFLSLFISLCLYAFPVYCLCLAAYSKFLSPTFSLAFILPFSRALDYCRSMLTASLIHVTDLASVLNTRHVVLSLIQRWQQDDESSDRDQLAPQSIDRDGERLWFETKPSSSRTHVLLNRPVNLWTELFRDLFLSRVAVRFRIRMHNICSCVNPSEVT